MYQHARPPQGLPCPASPARLPPCPGLPTRPAPSLQAPTLPVPGPASPPFLPPNLPVPASSCALRHLLPSFSLREGFFLGGTRFFPGGTWFFPWYTRFFPRAGTHLLHWCKFCRYTQNYVPWPLLFQQPGQLSVQPISQVKVNVSNLKSHSHMSQLFSLALCFLCTSWNRGLLALLHCQFLLWYLFLRILRPWWMEQRLWLCGEDLWILVTLISCSAGGLMDLWAWQEEQHACNMLPLQSVHKSIYASPLRGTSTQGWNDLDRRIMLSIHDSWLPHTISSFTQTHSRKPSTVKCATCYHRVKLQRQECLGLNQDVKSGMLVPCHSTSVNIPSGKHP